MSISLHTRNSRLVWALLCGFMLCLPGLAQSSASHAHGSEPSTPSTTQTANKTAAQKTETGDSAKTGAQPRDTATSAAGQAASAEPDTAGQQAPAPPVIKLDDLKDGATTPSLKTSKSNHQGSQSWHPLVEGLFFIVFLLLAVASLGLGIFGWREGSKIGFATFFVLSLIIAAAGFFLKKPVADLIAPMPAGGPKPVDAKPEPENDWATMTSDAFGISVLMKQPVTVKRTNVDKTGSVSVTRSDPDGSMTFSYGRIEEALKTKKEKEEQGLSSTADVDARAKKVVDEIHGTVISKTEIELKGICVGRDISGQIPDSENIFHLHIYVTTDGDFYELAVLGKESYVNTPEAMQFLDSLHLKAQDAIKEQEEAAKKAGAKSTMAGGDKSSSDQAMSEEMLKKFYSEATQAMQSNLKLGGCEPFSSYGFPRKVVLNVVVDSLGKVTKVEVKSNIQSPEKEKLSVAAIKAVTKSAPYTMPERMPSEFEFKVTLMGDKIGCGSFAPQSKD